MGFLSSVGALASSALGSVGSGLSYVSPVLGSVGSIASSGNFGGWLDFSSGQSKLKDAYRRSLQAEEYTARNSPSWTVDGLRQAGLNPILALQDGSVTAAHGVNPTLSQGEGEVNFSLKKRTDKENELLEEQAKSASATASNLEANTAKIHNDIKNDNLRTSSDIAVNNAKIANMSQDTENKLTTRGLGGIFGMSNQFSEGLSRFVRSSAHFSNDAVERGVFRAYDKTSKDGWKGARPFLLPEEKQVLKKVGASLSNSAKDFSEGYKKHSSLMLNSRLR